MIPKEILKKVQKIHIHTRRVVNDVLAGQYHSTFKGRGIEFDEVREYQPGDDIRTIDWNVTARMDRPFIKKFVEERELTVMLLVDISGSGKFGSQDQLKNEFAAELCAALAFSAIKNNDKVGLMMFSDKVEKYIPPKKGIKHVLRVIRDVMFYEPKGCQTNIRAALEYLDSVSSRRTVTFLVSDFMSSGYQRSLQILNKRHDVIAVIVQDPREITIPKVGFIEFEDAETGERIIVDTSEKQLRDTFHDLAQNEVAERLKMFKQINVDAIQVQTDKPYVEPMMRFFRKRVKMR
ncbi:MAG: DUF58 domain-containing protein [Chlamydiota bacterium]|nr:DUF58 domain-containing protein [Chlamydiota bacterium]